jgi:hypothetical protein
MGVINTNQLGKLPQITPRAVADFIVTHGEALASELRKYREAVRRAETIKP